MPVRNEQALYSLKIGNVFKSRKRLLEFHSWVVGKLLRTTGIRYPLMDRSDS